MIIKSIHGDETDLKHTVCLIRLSEQGQQIKGVGGRRGGQGPPSWQPGPKVVPSDFTYAHFQENMSLFLIIKTTYCFVFS